MHVEVVGDVAVDLVQERDEVGAGVGLADVGDHRAGRDVQGGEQVAGAVALVVMGGPLPGVVGSIGRVGAVRLSAWIWGFSSTANTAAATGGFMYSATRSRIFSTSCGIGGHLEAVLDATA